jgi:enamine deaminase RidA (YjgF/YER057c/UK114 family)
MKGLALVNPFFITLMAKYYFMKRIQLLSIVSFIIFFTSCNQKSSHMLYTVTPDAKLKEMGIEIPKASAPVANYVNVVRTGNLIYTSGKGPNRPDGSLVTGKVGKDLTVEQGYEAAKLCAIQLLAVIKDELHGDLSKVKRVVKVLGMVNCETDFTSQPEVINGCSDFLVKVFGDRGKHARSAVGMGSLPRNIAVEIELIVEVED